MKIQDSQYLSTLQLNNRTPKKNQIVGAGALQQNGLSFQQILDNRSNKTDSTSEVRFSKHAMNRLADRNISLTSEQMERLNDGTQKAGAKGIKDSLVLVDQLAFIVNVPSSTVVTAMDQSETDENVFTNIDGAVIM